MGDNPLLVVLGQISEPMDLVSKEPSSTIISKLGSSGDLPST